MWCVSLIFNWKLIICKRGKFEMINQSIQLNTISIIDCGCILQQGNKSRRWKLWPNFLQLDNRPLSQNAPLIETTLFPNADSSAFYFYRTRVRSLGMLVSDSLTDCRLVNLIDVTLACEDAYSKLVEVVTVAHVDAEDHVGNSLLQIWELMFGPKAKLLFRLWAQGWSRFWSWSSGEILKLKFGQHFAADVWLRFWI